MGQIVRSQVAPSNPTVPSFDPRKRLLHEDVVHAVEVEGTIGIVVVRRVHPRVERGEVPATCRNGERGVGLDSKMVSSHGPSY